jgi:P27 family predicted phage terminase small subunit
MASRIKTAHEHFVEGTTSKAKTGVESVYVGGRPKIPGHLSAAARSEFKRACKILLERGTATPGDFVTLALYAEVYARWVESKKQLGFEFIVTTKVTDNNGNLRTVDRPNPLIKVVETAEGRLHSLARTLGLTPGDRDKVRKTKTADDAKPANPMDEFMARRPRPVLFPKKTEQPNGPSGATYVNPGTSGNGNQEPAASPEQSQHGDEEVAES